MPQVANRSESTTELDEHDADTLGETEQDGADGASSGAHGEDTDLLSVARDVVQRGREGQADSPAADAGQEGSADQPGKKPGQGAAPDDYSDVPFHKHPRFQQVIQEKNGLAAKVAELEPRVAVLEPKAKSYDEIQGFMRENALSPEEASDGLAIMGLAKLDPVQAWQQLQPWLQSLAMAAGEILPDDLKAKVDRKELTVDQALAISRANAAARSADARSRFHSTRQQRSSEEALAQERKEAVDAWADDMSKRDPDWSRVSPLLSKWVRAEIAEKGVPRTPRDAVQMAQRLYKDVKDHLRSLAPRKPTRRPVTGAPVAGSPAAKPKTLREAAELALARGR